MNYARRQQYRRIFRAGRAAAGSVAAVVLALVVGAAGAVSLAGLLLLTAIGLGLCARHWLSLAQRSRVGARSEDEVRRALASLEAEGWRLRHALPWQGREDIDSVAIAPTGVAVAIVFCPDFGCRECPSLCGLLGRVTRSLPGCPSACVAALAGWHSVVSRWCCRAVRRIGRCLMGTSRSSSRSMGSCGGCAW